jgi:hypothetical protein
MYICVYVYIYIYRFIYLSFCVALFYLVTSSRLRPMLVSNES